MYRSTRRTLSILSTTVLVLIPVLALSVAVAAAPAAVDNWESTEWIVRCGAKAGEDLDAADCDDDNTTGAAAVTRSMLEDASPWLKGLGFRGPDISTRREATRKYVAWIAPSEVAEEVYGSYDGEKLYLASTYFFATGSDEGELARDVPNIGSAVHELFHAIQHAYDSDIYWSDDHDWIFEGSAEAVMLMWLRKTGAEMIPGTRYFDYPLHEPYTEVGEDGEVVCDDCYATNRFWLWLGDELGSTDNVQYLHDFLQEDLDDARGLAALDGFLTEITLEGQILRGGLYDVYPAFIAESVRQSVFFSEDGYDAVEIPYTGSKVERPRKGTVRPVAANAHDVTISVPEGETAGLKVEFAEDHDDLHLVVGEQRYDRVPRGAGADADRNVFRTSLTGRAEPHELSVRVVNVDEIAAESEQHPYTLEITVEPLDPCEPEFMDRAVNYDHQLMPLQAGVFGKAVAMGFQTGRGTLEISGLVSDGGGACTSPLYASALGRLAGSDGDPEPVDQEKAARAAEQMRRRVEQMAQEIFGKSMDEVTDEDLENMTPEQKRLMAEMMGLEGQMPSTWRDKEGDVVIPVYSPHATTWEGGGLMPPLNTRHGGLAGWSPNSAALFNLHLVGTEAADLEEGGSYPAEAVARPEAGAALERGVVDTRLAFYTSWNGRFVDDCGEVPPQFEAAMAGLIRQLDPEGEYLQTEDTTPGCLVSGSSRVLYGQLSGQVTIDEITGATVVGSFELSGPGTLRIGDSDAGDREQAGSVTVKGSFSVPTERVPYE